MIIVNSIKHNGFTIIEAIVSLALFAIAFSGLYLFFGMAQQANNNSEKKSSVKDENLKNTEETDQDAGKENILKTNIGRLKGLKKTGKIDLKQLPTNSLVIIQDFELWWRKNKDGMHYINLWYIVFISFFTIRLR